MINDINDLAKIVDPEDYSWIRAIHYTENDFDNLEIFLKVKCLEIESELICFKSTDKDRSFEQQCSEMKLLLDKCTRLAGELLEIKSK